MFNSPECQNRVREMTTTTLRNDEVTVSHRDVVVTRELTSKEEGIVGTVEIRSHRDEPVLVHVVDEFPTDLPAESVAFRPENEPEGGSISPQRASIIHTVEDDAACIEYGIKLPESVGEVQFDDPTIRGAEAAGVTRSAAPATDGGGQSRGSDDGSASSESILQRLALLDRESAGDDADAERPEDAVGATDSAATEDALGDDEAPETAGPTAPEDATATDDGTVDEATNQMVEQAIERVGTADGDAPVEAEEEGLATDETTEDSRMEPDSGAESLGADDQTETAMDVDEADDGEETAQEDGADESAGRPASRSVDVRLDRLSARIEEFAAYADALEGIIDEHGTAPEFIDRIEDELDDIDDRLDAVRDEVDSVQDRHEEDLDDVHADLLRVDDELGRVDDDVAHLESDVEQNESAIRTVEDDVDEVEADLESVRNAVETVEEEVATVSDEVETMHDELETLHTEVEALQAFRDSLAQAFGPQTGAVDPTTAGASNEDAAQASGDQSD